LKAAYRITYEGDKKKRTNFGIEFNINLLAGNAPDRYYHVPGQSLKDRKLASMGELKDVSEIHLIDEWNGMDVILKMDKRGHLIRFPVETVSLSESGFEKIFQGSCLLFYWPLELELGKEFEVNIELGIHHFVK
jgi:alpha-amylase